jgi:DNA-binding MarR family transcriptional regulator
MQQHHKDIAMATATAAPTEISAALEFCFRLNRAYSTLTRRLDVALGTYHGLSFADFMLLASLSGVPGGRLRRVDLAERLGLTASGVTRALIPLEKIGLVKRQPDPRDARIGYAAITPAGEKLLRHAMESAEDVSGAALGAVSAKQVEALSAALGQLAGLK